MGEDWAWYHCRDVNGDLPDRPVFERSPQEAATRYVRWHYPTGFGCWWSCSGTNIKVRVAELFGSNVWTIHVPLNEGEDIFGQVTGGGEVEPVQSSKDSKG